MKALRPILAILMLIALAPLAIAAPTGAAIDGFDLWAEIVDPIARAFEIAVEAVMPEPGNSSDSAPEQNPEPADDPILEGYPLVEPFGLESYPLAEPFG